MKYSLIKFLLFGMLICASINIYAQNIDPKVEVSREFDVKLIEIRKPNLNMDINDSLQRFKINFDYSIFERPYKDLYEFSPRQTARIQSTAPTSFPIVFAKMGVQYPLMPSAEIALQAISKAGLYLGIYGSHNSFWGSVPDVYGSGSISTDRMKNKIGSNLKYAWGTGELNIDVNYDFDKYKFLEAPNTYIPSENLSIAHFYPDTTAHSNNIFSAKFNVKSAYNEDNSLYYDFGISYKNTDKFFSSLFNNTISNQLAENMFTIGGCIGTNFDVHRVYLDVLVKSVSYTGTKDHSAGLVEFSPIYEYKRGRFFGKFGVKFGNMYGSTQSSTTGSTVILDHSTPVNNIFPDVDARFEIIRKYFWVHALIGGANDLNAFSSFLESCPWIATDATLLFGSRPLDTKISFESLIKDRLAINIFSSFTIFKNMAVFSPVYKSSNLCSISTEYWDTNKLSFGIEAFWKSKSFAFGGNFNYNHYYLKDGTAFTALPSLEGKMYVRYNWRERIVLSADCQYRSAVSGDYSFKYEVPEIINLNTDVSLVLNKNFSVFIELNNLLDNVNQYFPLYAEPGINFGGGLCIKL
ncbi:MAG: hypothetical protein M0R23_05795 [Bacteroidales bacterium]|nr:hypothetical protein [Bacteroidales bacterium]